MRLRASNLVAGYGRLPVVHGVDFEILGGELVAIIGPNGAGKTTLLRTLSKTISPLNGEIRLDEDDVSSWGPDRMARAGVAYVPQENNVFGGLSVRENLELCSDPGRSRGLRPEKAYRAFPPLEHRASQRASTLSGGERQMLAIAQVMLAEPHILLLDEPTSGLAPRIAAQLGNWIKRAVESGVSVVWVVEQSPEETLRMADRVCVLSAGLVRFSGRPEEELSSEDLMGMFVE